MLENVSDDAWFKSVPRELPLFIISGDADPVGRWGEVFKVVYENLCEAGVSNVTLKLYPGARHELLNEQNRGEVFDDVLAFFEKHI